MPRREAVGPAVYLATLFTVALLRRSLVEYSETSVRWCNPARVGK